MGSSGKYAGKSKGLAIVLALFLGGLGIHKFYLRRIWLGLLYLLFCWTLIPVLLGVIDAIVLATKNGREFSGAAIPSKSSKNPVDQRVEAVQSHRIREDLRSALEIGGFHRRVIAKIGVQANEHIPKDAKVLCALLTLDGMNLLLDTGILRLELKKSGTVAELIPFTSLSRASERKSFGTYWVDIQMPNSHPGVLSGFTSKSENSSKFVEVYSSINHLAVKKSKLREDFARALGVGEDYVPDDQDLTIESYIPVDSKVVYLLKPGYFILLDNGVLRMKLKLFAPISGAEFVPLSQIMGVTVTDRNPGYAVEVRRDEGTVVIAGSSFKTNDFFGLTESRDEAFKFQDLLLGLMKPSGPTASDIKELLEKLISSSGKSPAEKLEELSNLRYQNLLSDHEFELAKSKILGI